MIRRTAVITVLALLSTLLVMPFAHAELSADQRMTILSEAQAQYDHAVSLLTTDPAGARTSFASAAERFQQLIDDGIANSSLEYNLANAYLKAGDIGRAILHYRRAQTLDPADPRVQHNLEHARTLRRNRITPAGDVALVRSLFAWHNHVSPAIRVHTFLITYTLFWLLLIGAALRSNLRVRWFTITLAALWLATGASIAVEQLIPSQPEGVLLTDNTIVRKGNGEGYQPQFEQPLHAGVEFILLESRGDWLHIQLPDKSTGWIPTSRAALLNDPA